MGCVLTQLEPVPRVTFISFMIQSAITICLAPEARTGPFVYHGQLPEGCAKAAALGFDAVELFPRSAREIDPGQVRQALKVQPWNADAHFIMGELLSEQGRKDEAAREYREALRIDPTHPGVCAKLNLESGR